MPDEFNEDQVYKMQQFDHARMLIQALDENEVNWIRSMNK